MRKWLVAIGCAGGLTTATDSRSTEPDVAAPATVMVAAIQYTGAAAREVDASCAEGDNNCAIEALVRRAQGLGASLVVTPEYALDQEEPDAAPDVGQPPSEIARAPLAARFANLAQELGIYLVVGLETMDGGHLRNTQLAFDPSGTVVGKHHKFELYASEKETMTAGDDVMVFDTDFGRVGMLICADLYGDPTLHDKLTGELGANIVAFSAMWTVSRATRWPAAFARDWGVHVVAANGSGGAGKGGGIFAPTGKPLAVYEQGGADVTTASIPIKK